MRRQLPVEKSDRLVRRAALLPKDDRELVTAVIERGVSVAALSRVCGNGMSARALRHRLRRLIGRLMDERFTYVASRITGPGGWSARKRAVARLRFVEGASVRIIAARLRLSLHQARRHVAAIEAGFAEVAS
jgi:DNA-directed RNA polymerase specialized sigma24 family protein